MSMKQHIIDLLNRYEEGYSYATKQTFLDEY